MPERPGTEVVAAARKWWDGNAGRKRFLWVHLYDCHAPYRPPPPFDARYRAEPVPRRSRRDGCRARASAGAASVRVGRGARRRDVGPWRGAGRSRGADPRPLRLRGDAEGPAPSLASGRRRAGRERGSCPPRRHRAHDPGRRRVPQARLLDRLVALPGRPAADPSGSYFESFSAAYNRGWAPLRGVIAEGTSTSTCPSGSSTTCAPTPAERRDLSAAKPELLRRLARQLPAESAIGASERRAGRRRPRAACAAWLPLRKRGPEKDLHGRRRPEEPRLGGPGPPSLRGSLPAGGPARSGGSRRGGSSPSGRACRSPTRTWGSCSDRPTFPKRCGSTREAVREGSRGRGAADELRPRSLRSRARVPTRSG